MIFPFVISDELLNCKNITNPSLDSCTDLKLSEENIGCCFISVTNKTDDEVYEFCDFVEMTEFAIKIYKHSLKMYKKIKILCSTELINFSVILPITFLIVLF